MKPKKDKPVWRESTIKESDQIPAQRMNQLYDLTNPLKEGLALIPLPSLSRFAANTKDMGSFKGPPFDANNHRNSLGSAGLGQPN